MIEEKEFKDKQDMLFKERHYIEMFECVNKLIPIRTNEEMKESRKISDNKYNTNNKEHVIHIKYLQYNKENIKTIQTLNSSLKKNSIYLN